MEFYYPVLRHSNSEMNALKNTWDSTKERIIPIIEGKRISRKNKEKWDKTLNSSGKFLKERVGDNLFIYDFKNIFDNLKDHSTELLKDGLNPIDFLFNKFVESELKFIPCIDHDSPQWLIESVKKQNPTTIAIRIRYHDIQPALYTTINTYVENIIQSEFNNKSVYIIFDFKDELNEVEIKKNTKHFNNDYKKILSITSLDESKDVDKMSFQKVSDRTELTLFNKLTNELPELSFSDYTTRLTPEPDLKDGFNMNNSYLKIYYTTEDGYYLGKSYKYDEGEPENFQEVCELITNSGLYSGEKFTLADEEIYRCSQKLEEVLTHQKTIEMAINHHLQFTINEL
ncbi:hypothetical protein RZN25_16880 [Bacillaceae bacterium S4-13-56]